MPAYSAALFSLALGLTALGAVVTFLLWRRRGAGPGLVALGWTLVPMGLWLTKTLKLVTLIVDQVSSWALNFVWNPRVWLGLIVLGVAAGLIGTGRVVRRRTNPAARAAKPAARVTKPATRADRAATRHDDGMDDIEAILKKHGIS